MSKDLLTVHTMVKNESQYIKQTLRAVAPFGGRIIVVDTGSTDDTIDKVRELQNDFKNIELYLHKIDGDSTKWDGSHLSQKLTDIRNTMLKMTKTPYVWQLDGDEIYTQESIDRLLEATENLKYSITQKGLMVKIKWCISNSEYTAPGPYPKTLRVFPSEGRWFGEFPNEFLYVDGRPIFINDYRCNEINAEFLHMSMALHPERRPANGVISPLTEEEKALLNV